MANQAGNGRNVLRPDDNRENGWQPDTQPSGQHWEDSDRRGTGQSGYGAGRRDDDPSVGFERRNPLSPSQHDQTHEGLDDRWTGRGSSYGRGQQGMPGYGQQSMYEPSHRGKGPKNYTRSDDRIREQVCETLSDDHHVDASDIEVAVQDGEVTLTGHVADRRMKRAAEDCIDRIAGVNDVHNQLRVGNPK